MEIALILLLLTAFGIWHGAAKKKADKSRELEIEQLSACDEQRLDDEDARQEKAVHDLLVGHVVEHERTLLTKRRQLIVADDYGGKDRSRWYRELDYFIDRVCDPSILQYYKRACEHEDSAYFQIEVIIEQMLDALGGSAEPASYCVDMPGIDFERLVAERLASAGADVRFTPASGDQGADLIVKHNGGTIVVQCKRSASTVGNKAVQEAYAGRKFHDAEQAWVVSDAPFSRAARQLASSLSVRLVDFDQVEAAL